MGILNAGTQAKEAQTGLPYEALELGDPRKRREGLLAAVLPRGWAHNHCRGTHFLYVVFTHLSQRMRLS